jgi:hypothetical protein
MEGMVRLLLEVVVVAQMRQVRLLPLTKLVVMVAQVLHLL